MILIRDDEVSGRAGSPCDQMARLRNVNGYQLTQLLPCRCVPKLSG